ncbi:hypothetical protein MKW98_000087 [Papaver atlanticum]|uniref:Cytochrome c assembly protein domain-containing protein n=1 Tax=Papaver atlanticum TaxID=357466 RepID=A0AAD4XL92_9MAGN|nr:hypothetical protein MKW98_000087 [Papaver atlanticum]
MSILVYFVMPTNSSFFLLTKHPPFLRSSGTGTEIDARLTSALILFLIYLGVLRFQKLSVELASISICVGPINIPIIKFSVNWWNTLHQPGSISRSGTSIHVSMLIRILSNFANSPFFTLFFFVLETRLLILSFLESSLTRLGVGLTLRCC